MKSSAETQCDLEGGYVQLLERAAADADVLGLILGGSRGKGLTRPGSDYDVDLVVADGAVATYRSFVEHHARGNDVQVFTLSGFRDHAAWGSPTAWARYNYAHLSVQHDRTGGVLQQLVDEKACVPEEVVVEHIDRSIDLFVNQVYRSLKALRDGNRIANRLEAAEGVRGFLEAVFCMHDRRLVPYHKYLEWELTRAPLTSLALNTPQLLDALLAVLSDTNAAAQRTLLEDLVRVARSTGHERIIESWGDALAWMMGSARGR